MSMEKYYVFAGVEIGVEAPDDRIYEDEWMLTPFAVPEAAEPHWFRFHFRDELAAPSGKLLMQDPTFCVYDEGDATVRYLGKVQTSWQQAFARIERRGRETTVYLKNEIYPHRISAKTVLNCMAAEHMAVQAGGVVFHSSYIDHRGEGILFTAPSGTGKSTQADLWEKLRGAEIVNGDRSVVRATENGTFACGIPFAGSSPFCKNKTLPLKAIVYLKQAPVTRIRRLRGTEAFRRIWEGCSVNAWDKQDMALASETVLRILETVPVFELACTPDESAVLALEGALWA